MKKRALVSVSDKTGIVKLAKQLSDLGYEILSTGGTAKTLQEEGIPVTPVEDITKFPECFSGRVKTMHPKLMGGILFERKNDEHIAQARTYDIDPIDLVIVNLYPFEKMLTQHKSESKNHESLKHAALIENIDIGGPTLLRSAAKNYESVTAICDPADYEKVLLQLTQTGKTTQELRKNLAAKVFAHTAAYDALIAEYLSEGRKTGLMLTDGMTLRYGENPHQSGTFFRQWKSIPTTKSATHQEKESWTLLQGKALSYLNILDIDAAWSAALAFDDPTTIMVKHANPSGIASHKNIADAFQRAYDADRLSAFGVIIALNRPCTEEIAQKIMEQKIFVEVIIAPSFEESARKILAQKAQLRLVQCSLDANMWHARTVYRSAMDGMLVQQEDNATLNASDVRCVTDRQPSSEQMHDLLFAWKAVKYAKSNAIVLAKNLTTVGIGAGQTSRVDATWIAAKRAGENARGAVLASDAFFPFPDALEEAAKVGISAIIQPGGSIRDAEVCTRANELGIPMVFTDIRAFRH